MPISSYSRLMLAGGNSTVCPLHRLALRSWFQADCYASHNPPTIGLCLRFTLSHRSLPFQLLLNTRHCLIFIKISLQFKTDGSNISIIELVNTVIVISSYQLNKKPMYLPWHVIELVYLLNLASNKFNRNKFQNIVGAVACHLSWWSKVVNSLSVANSKPFY